MTSIDSVAGQTVDYQNLGGDAYEIVVGGQATQGTVIPVGETDWVAISRRGTMLGYHPSREAAAAVVVNEWVARSRSVSLGTSRPSAVVTAPPPAGVLGSCHMGRA